MRTAGSLPGGNRFCGSRSEEAPCPLTGLERLWEGWGQEGWLRPQVDKGHRCVPASVGLFPSRSGGAGKAVWLSCSYVAVASVSSLRYEEAVSALCGVGSPGGGGAGMGPLRGHPEPSRARAEGSEDQILPHQLSQ